MLEPFPHFKGLSLDDRDAYEQLIADYPPFSDISFATLHIWWNLENKLRLAELNGNLVIDYQLPHDKENSGLSLIGRLDLENSIQTIFDYLKKEGQPVKLVHVPEFVISMLTDRQAFDISEELDYNEYIIDSRGLSSLEDALYGRIRRKVRRFLREVEEREVEFRELDLSSEEVRNELFEAVVAWETSRSMGNDPGKTEHLAIKKTLSQAEKLGIRHVGLYVDGKLYAIILYHLSHDKKHFILNHLKVDYSIPYIFDYMTHHIAGKAAEEGVDFLNMEMDLGIESLRQHKMRLRPVDFFKKYTVKPLA